MSDDTTPFQQLLDEATRLGLSEPKPTIPELVLRLKRAFPAVPSGMISLIAETVQTRDIAVRKLGEWSRDGLFTKALLEPPGQFDLLLIGYNLHIRQRAVATPGIFALEVGARNAE